MAGRGDAAVRGGERVCTSQGADEHLVPLLADVVKGASKEGTEATLKVPLRRRSVLAFLDRFVESYAEAAASGSQEEARCSDQEAATRHAPVEKGIGRTCTDASRDSDDAFSFSGLDWDASTSGSATPRSGSETGQLDSSVSSSVSSSGDDEHHDEHGAPPWRDIQVKNPRGFGVTDAGYGCEGQVGRRP